MLERKRRNPLYDFLMNPRYGRWRWFAYAVLMFVITLREVVFSYQGGLAVLGGLTLLLILITFINNFLLSTCLFIWAIPKLLFRNRYFYFLLVVLGSVFVSVALKVLIESFVVKHFAIPSIMSLGISSATILEWIAKYTMILVCIFGGMSIFLLKNWIREKKHILRMENSQKKSELESLKEQVSPDLLLGILNKVGNEAENDPEKASEMLMLLGQVLRYELYDCNRTRVLLTSEMKFLENYLNLVQYRLNTFDYTLHTEGNLNMVLMPPMLLIFFVQVLAEHIYDKEAQGCKDYGHVDFTLEVKDKQLHFACQHGFVADELNISFANIKRRLSLLFSDGWFVENKDRMLNLKIDVNAKR
ncbi:MAG TPA: histidine kinase [Paludibacteraceae bacterium]|nr:histidine kinase [Paludibacteraceae bacterium]HQF50668.1 histidine kinase [Paludibacteraceae bacterium]